MNTFLSQKSNRILIAFGMYLLYELSLEIIENNYNIKCSLGDKSINLQKGQFVEDSSI